MADGRLAEACAAFEESQKLQPAVTTLLNLAGCREQNRQLATAWGLFIEAERETRNSDDATTQQLHDVAQNRATQLEPRVSKLTIHIAVVDQIDGLTILRGSDTVDPQTWNRTLPVDGGLYTITARAPGMAPWSTQVTVALESDNKTVDVPRLLPQPSEAKPASTAATSTTSPSATPTEAVSTPTPRMNLQRWGAVGAAGAGLVALGIGVWAGVDAHSKAIDARDGGCNHDLSACPTSALGTANEAYSRGNLATGMFIAAAVLVGGAAALWLTAPPPRGEKHNEGDEDATTLQVTPYLGRDHAGLCLVGRF